MKLTDPQARALLALSGGPKTPAELGEAMGRLAGAKGWWGGRQGGPMGRRLVDMGLARRSSARRFDGWESVWIITPAGRKALAAWKDGR